MALKQRLLTSAAARCQELGRVAARAVVDCNLQCLLEGVCIVRALQGLSVRAATGCAACCVWEAWGINPACPQPARLARVDHFWLNFSRTP